MKELKENDVVTLFARKWFDKVNGNTYHSVQVYINGDLVGQNNFEYGYDDQYEVTAKELLKEKYILPWNDETSYHGLYYLRNYGIKYVYGVTNVNTRKALKF